MTRSTVMFAVSAPHQIGPVIVDKIARITAAFDADLELFRCVFDSDAIASEQAGPERTQAEIEQLVLRARQELEAAAEPFAARGLHVRTSIRWDHPPYEGIVRQVLRHRPRLLFAQSTHRDPVARLFLQHTDWKLIEACPCPLVLLKSARPYAAPLVIAAVDPGHRHDKPAALDEQILDGAALMSTALAGRLAVFHARTPWDEAARSDPDLRDLPEYRDEEIHRAYLAQVEARVLGLAEKHHISAAQVHVEDGHPAELLPQFVGQHQADLLVMGAVSRSRLRRALIGHTAQRVLDALDTDVLIVKPPGFRTPVRRQSHHHVRSGAEARPRLIW